MYSDGEGTSLLFWGTLFGILAGFTITTGLQLIENKWNFFELDWGQIVNNSIVGGSLGFSFAMGVVYLGPVLAGSATVSGMSATIAFAISIGVNFTAGSFGYVMEEIMNGRTVYLDDVIYNGIMVSIEGAIKFFFGGIAGSVGKIGTKGKPLRSKEWWLKFVFGQEFTAPFKYGIDLLRRIKKRNE